MDALSGATAQAATEIVWRDICLVPGNHLEIDMIAFTASSTLNVSWPGRAACVGGPGFKNGDYLLLAECDPRQHTSLPIAEGMQRMMGEIPNSVVFWPQG